MSSNTNKGSGLCRKFKPRFEPVKLKILRFLNTRMNLTVKEKQYYLNLEKGFEGEVMFDTLTEELQSECLIIRFIARD